MKRKIQLLARVRLVAGEAGKIGNIKVQALSLRRDADGRAAMKLVGMTGEQQALRATVTSRQLLDDPAQFAPRAQDRNTAHLHRPAKPASVENADRLKTRVAFAFDIAQQPLDPIARPDKQDPARPAGGQEDRLRRIDAAAQIFRQQATGDPSATHHHDLDQPQYRRDRPRHPRDLSDQDQHQKIRRNRQRRAFGDLHHIADRHEAPQSPICPQCAECRRCNDEEQRGGKGKFVEDFDQRAGFQPAEPVQEKHSTMKLPHQQRT